jgi:phosphate transport system protein
MRTEVTERTKFTAYKMTELEIELVQMGEEVREALTRALLALNNRDCAVADRVIAQDEFINATDFRIVSACTALLATGAATASERRRAVATLRAVADLERIGDHAVNIAQWAKEIAVRPETPPPAPLWDLARATLQMFVQCLGALKQAALEPLYRLKETEEAIDQLRANLFMEILNRRHDHDDLSLLDLLYLFAASDLERVADHVTNIAENALFARTGELTKLNG